MHRIAILFATLLVATSTASAGLDGSQPKARKNASSRGQRELDLTGFDSLRQQAINRPRRLIFNNDGNEPIYLCGEVSKEELLKSRTTPLAGSQVDSIFYCTWSSGFGLFTHNTKVGQVFKTREAMFSNNLAQAFLDQGIDPLQMMIEFGHRNVMEVFWSMRMNDTHDASTAAYGPVMFRANQLKLDHPEFLIGSKTNRPKYGSWSAVDYGVDEVRELAFRYCEEVCRNYDVDGIELDFFRHAFLFKCSGRGEPCGPTELNQLTDLLRRIREMSDTIGRKKKKSILLAVRVPDSIEYCKVIGIDLEKWLADGLVDLLVVSGYTQLNPWEYSAALGRKHGVKVYSSLDEPRVRDEAARKLRANNETYRSRAMNAWAAGMDGIYMFNFFDPRSPLWRELHNTNTLAQLERQYFASVRGPGSMPVPHQAFINVPVLNPANRLPFTNRVVDLLLATGENGQQVQPSTLHLHFSKKVDAGVLCNFNNLPLTNGTWNDQWLQFELAAGSVQRTNSIRIISEDKGLALNDAYLSIRPSTQQKTQ